MNSKAKTTELKTTSDFLNDLVLAYREMVPDSAGALIEAFEPLLDKYFRLLYDGIWDIKDRDVVSFLKMMGRWDPESIASSLRNSCRRLYEPEDIRQELIQALLVTANQYTNISRNFKYVLKDQAQKGFLKDAPILDRIVDDVDIEDAYYFVETGAIDTAWVKGLTATDGFDKLTTIQRAIIKYLYNDGLAEAVAASKLKMSVRQLQRHKRKAKEILADFYKIEE